MQSEGSLSIASTGKDPKTGRLETQHYQVNGPVTILMTTTNPDLDEELANRCFVLDVNDSREQTRRIHERQREAATLSGLKRKKERQRLIPLHRNAGRLLKPVEIVNPFADFMSFPDRNLRSRRDHQKYLNLVYAIAFLHQYQRPQKTDPALKGVFYIEVELEDIRQANRLCAHVLSRTLDELQPQTRKLLKTVTQMVKETAEREALEVSEVRFTRRELRHYSGLSDNRVHIHLSRLVSYEYLSQIPVPGINRYVYELLYAREEESEPSVFSGLVDTELLQKRLAASKTAGNPR
jgi:hypothetical protein